jgi:hypothetical protein
MAHTRKMWDLNDDPRSATTDLDGSYYNSYRLSRSFVANNVYDADELYASRITSLPPFPLDSTDIDVVGCGRLRALPPLPPGTLSLNCNRCSSLRALPLLPPGMQTLSTYCCRRLRFLPPLPASLGIVNCCRCPRLVDLPALPVRTTSGPTVVLCDATLRLPDVCPPNGVHLNFQDLEPSAVQWVARVRARHFADRCMVAHLPVSALLFV